MKGFDPAEFDNLPRDVRRKLKAGLRKFLASIGVTPMIDKATGEMVVDLKAMAMGMGMTEEEAIADLNKSGFGQHCRTIKSSNLTPMQ